MEKKVLKNHVKGNKSIGKTNWAKVFSESNRPKIDDDNPELVGKKHSIKLKKPNIRQLSNEAKDLKRTFTLKYFYN